MSEEISRKIVYLTVDNKRYKFTEIIEVLHDAMVEIVDLTNDDERPTTTTEGSPQYCPHSPQYCPHSPEPGLSPYSQSMVDDFKID